MQEPQPTYEHAPTKGPMPGNRKRLILFVVVLALAAAALVVGLRLFSTAGGCCQCPGACTDVTRSSQCDGLCGGQGVYMSGKSCVRNTCQ